MFIATLLLILFFVFASSIKLTGWHTFIFETQLAFFERYGLNRIHMFLVGLIEMSAALALTASILFNFSLLNELGSFAIFFTSIGAMYFHFKYDTVKDAIPAIITACLSLSLITNIWIW